MLVLLLVHTRNATIQKRDVPSAVALLPTFALTLTLLFCWCTAISRHHCRHQKDNLQGVSWDLTLHRPLCDMSGVRWGGDGMVSSEWWVVSGAGIILGSNLIRPKSVLLELGTARSQSWSGLSLISHLLDMLTEALHFATWVLLFETWDAVCSIGV